MATYEKVWHRLQHFPTILAIGSKRPPGTSGSAAAALISVGIGCFMMMVTHHFAETSIEIDSFILGLGKWIPGSNTGNKLWGTIGSYAGKETMLLVSWLVSWFVLQNLLKHKQVKTKTIFMWTFGLIVAATVMTWQPLFLYLPL
ncbi:hypothetical protein [Chamaesiphon sp. OTE_75_metabat_556]|uniref:hypothetical protein n=1 Tax=Chamaesiphon sp. OTE_75_metabat_556 TaxID=2964692 RepID=UPI00286A6471|nr:hypothetical protein [Chamaesiphon sp. OTE_75_metabat_556]